MKNVYIVSPPPLSPLLWQQQYKKPSCQASRAVAHTKHFLPSGERNDKKGNVSVELLKWLLCDYVDWFEEEEENFIKNKDHLDHDIQQTRLRQGLLYKDRQDWLTNN